MSKKQVKRYENLKTFRESINKSQVVFAKEIGINSTTYNNYETGARAPGNALWEAIYDRYGVSIDYLMGKHCDPYPHGTPEMIPGEERKAKIKYSTVVIEGLTLEECDKLKELADFYKSRRPPAQLPDQVKESPEYLRVAEGPEAPYHMPEEDPEELKRRRNAAAKKGPV